MPRVLYISTALTNNESNYLNETLKRGACLNGGMPQSANKFHRLFAEGLINNNFFVDCVSGRNVSYKTHSKLFYKKHTEKISKINYMFPAAINLPIIKQILNSFLIKNYCNKWLRKTKNKDDFVIIDASYVSVLPLVVKKINKKCKVVAIFADIYNYMADLGKKDKESIKIVRKIVEKAYSQIDGYIFLTEDMNSKINKYNKPYIVIEGIVDDTLPKVSVNKDLKDVLMYAGSLQKRFGLEDLINSYMKYNNNNSELWIYGDGDYRKNIESAALKDKRIKYFGNVGNEEIIAKEQTATFLINPRNPSYNFTKYSFPSKNMEYMLSGTPMIGYKLPGIPEEYNDYIIYIEDNILDTIEICFRNKNKLSIIGKNAQKFVLNFKNKNIQAKKIIDFVNKI